MNTSNKSNSNEIISNLTSIDFVVLAAMHDTDLKTMIKINALDLVKSCEKFFELKIMQKMNHEPSPELKIKIQNWLNSIEYKQYTKNTNQTLSVDDKESIRRIYSKLGLKPHDLSELTQAGEVFLEKKINEIKNKWEILIEYNKSNNPIKLKEEIDKCSKIIPIMFTIGIANPRLFSEMFKTMNLSMYGYLSKNKNIHPIFLDYIK
ncbi:hypothetical protein OAK22_04645 [Nitrosopumilus sp.]|nr:hypothetical protein [Nitrosopumilus sp.]